MDEEEYLDLKLEAYLIYQEELGGQTIRYREERRAPDTRATATDMFFGYSADPPGGEPSYTETELLFSWTYKAMPKEISFTNDQFDGEHMVKLYIPTMDLELKRVELKRERGYFVTPEGVPHDIVAIRPFPIAYSTSIMHQLLLRKRQPIDEDQE